MRGNAVARASEDQFAELVANLDAAEPLYDRTNNRLRIPEADEAFHVALVRLSRDAELEQMLANITGCIRYVRMIGLKIHDSAQGRTAAYRVILAGMIARDLKASSSALRCHIETRKKDATHSVRDAFSHIYVQAG